MKGEISMKKVELIDASAFLSETEKAVNLLQKRVDDIRTSANPQERLEILKKMLPEVDDFQQFEELNKEKATLEFTIKHAHEIKPIMPDEHREKILSNQAIELADIDEKLNQQYEVLNSYVEELEKNMLPLLINIYQLEERKDISYRLDSYADGVYSYINQGHVLRFEPFFGIRRAGIKSIPARAHYEMLRELIDYLKGKKQIGISKGRR